MNIEIVSIGDELLLGLTIDTNAVWLGRQLAERGVSVVRRATVGDDVADIVAAVREALERTGAVITTGGLGPTSDDLTNRAIAAVFGRELRLDDALWEALQLRWRELGRLGEIPEANKQQVMIPEGARVLANRHGSAPGVFIEDERGRWVAMLPGIPREMRGLCHDELLPIVQERLGDVLRVVRSRTLRTTGVAESKLPDLLGDAARGVDGMPLAYLPGQEGVDLRLTVRDASPEDADLRLRRGVDLLLQRVGEFAYAEERVDMAEVVLDACRARSLTVALAESCTGGMLGERLTAIPGSSDVLRGGVIAYANAVKQSALGVREATLESVGAVSEETAREMAAGARTRLAADIGIGITGIAGPGGGTPDKPVGQVCIAVDVQGTARSFGGRLIGDRAEIRFRATQIALDMVRRALMRSG